MSSFDTNGDYYTIRVVDSDAVTEAKKTFEDSHNDIMNFIINSAKQMAAFLESDNNETNILRTPSRRTSKRKRSFVSNARRSQTSAVKVKDVTTATPRRFSKRSKRSTIKLDTTIEPMEVQNLIEPIPNSVAVPSQLFREMSIREVSKTPETVVTTTVTTTIVYNEETVVTTKADQNKVMSPSELMSELSIKEDKETNNASEEEWMTDDEDCPQKKEQFFDAVDANESKIRDTKKSANNSSVNKTLTASSAVKDKHKKSLYFTPQTTQRSTRAQTRMRSRIADSSQKTPQTSSKISRLRDVSSSGETNSSRVAGSSSTRSVRSYSRIQKKGADNKTLTDSAMKRRNEAEEQRRIKLLASQEKEKRAIEKRRQLLEEKVNEKKRKFQEKANRAAEIRERQKQMETERLKKELEKRDESERKRQEDKKEQMIKRQTEMAQKAREIERRKQMKELEEMEIKLKRQEELELKQQQDRERLREQERMAAIIQQHNNSLQQKAVANSFIKKLDSNTKLLPKVVVTKMSPHETHKHMNHTYEVTQTTPEETQTKAHQNLTFVKNDSEKDLMSYDMTPPPKEPDYDNYDISQIQSDDDTDDEQQPRKRIPSWARGHNFIEQVHNQYNKTQRAVFREAKKVFGSGDAVLDIFKIEFDLMFPKKPVNPKYSKRTSSAVWEEPPSRYRFDESSVDQSFA